MSEKLKLKRDWVGRKVRTLREIETTGGTIFPEGTVMKVTRYFGGLHLEAIEACKHCKLRYRHRIKKIRERDVLLLPQD